MNCLVDATVMLLAGGRGTRMQPVLGELPKVLLPVNGRPFITFLLDQISSVGINKVVLCTGWGASEVQRVLGNEYRNLSLKHSVETSPLGTAGAIRQALSHADSEAVLIMNGDTYVDLDLREFWAWHGRLSCQASIAVTEVPDCRRFGSIELDDSDLVRVFREKPSEPSAGFVNTGVYLFERALLAGILPGKEVSLERDFLPTLIGEGLSAYRCQASFLDIGTPESYAEAPQFLSSITERTAGGEHG